MGLIHAAHQFATTALRRFTYPSLNQAAHRALGRAMSEIVDGAVSRDVFEALEDALDDASVRVVVWAVYDAMPRDSTHPSLDDFLDSAYQGAYVADSHHVPGPGRVCT